MTAGRTALATESEALDLRGVRCPLNWARARVRLDALPVGTRLALHVDDPRAVRDIPGAAEACGHVVLDIRAHGDSWWIEIER